MARTISPSTPAFSNYGDGIHPIVKGGFGSNSLDTIKAIINALDRTNTSTEGGVIPIGDNGKANLAPYGISINSVTISGPKQFNRTATTEYTITNYSALKEYTVSVSSGTITQSGDTLTLSANIVPAVVILTINNRNITLNKMVSNITKPLVTLGGVAFNDDKVTITATGTAFASSNGKTHASSSWDIATDVLFTNIVSSSVDNTTDKTTHAFESIDKVPTLYVRVMYKDNAGATSDWSSTVSINTVDLAIAINTPSVSFTGKKNNAGVKIVGTGSLFVTTDGGTHTATTWQVSSNADFTNVIYESQADTVNKSSIVMSVIGIAATYYMRIKHHSSIGNISGWSNIASVVRATMQDDIPKNEEALLVKSTGTGNNFGISVSISSDGSRVAIGAVSSKETYIFTRSGTTWTQEALLVKASGTGSQFGISVSISSDGSRVAVGAHGSNEAYIFTRSGTTWTQEALLVKASGIGNGFGDSVSISSDGSRVAIGAYGGGEAYIFTRSGTTWTQEALLVKASGIGNGFGISVSISSDGSRVAIGAHDSNEAYIFTRSGTTWAQEALLVKASGTGTGFGYSVSISSDGSRVAVGAHGGGEAYIFTRSGTTWTQEALLVKASGIGNGFGISVSISSDGSRVAIGAVSSKETYIFS